MIYNDNDNNSRKASELELLRYLSHWIYTKLRLYGQITQTDIDLEFDCYSSPLLYDGLRALEDNGIVYSDTVFNQEENRTEKIFYSKKVVI